MKKQISFDDEITIRTVHYGNYLKDDGDEDEYVEGNYPFEVQMEIQAEVQGSGQGWDTIQVVWGDKKPFRHLIEQQKIEEKIIKKYKTKYLKDE
jgi:hypothetical protein